jgi:EKC/KEOPS complex subunit CGI121/TPRKB
MTSGVILELPHLPGYNIHISLFKDVTNASFLRRQLVQANAEFEYAFLDATMVMKLDSALSNSSAKL